MISALFPMLAYVRAFPVARHRLALEAVATECRVVFSSGEKLTLKDQRFRDFAACMTENFKTVAKSSREIQAQGNALGWLTSLSAIEALHVRNGGIEGRKSYVLIGSPFVQQTDDLTR